MAGLTADEKIEIKAILEARLIDLRQQAQSAMQSVTSAETSLVEEGDIASQNANQAVAAKLLSRSNQQIKAIVKSLNDVKDDNYGFCDRCGEDIGFQRLQVCPTAEYCVTCQELEEKHKKLHRQFSDNPFQSD